MSEYTVQAAKTHLSRILHEVEAGATVTILRGSTPVAALTAVRPAPARTFGHMSFSVPDDFDEPLPAEEIALWE